MKVWVGITDDDWFRFLAGIQPDEVNFWQPGGGRTFRVLQPGELFLFKLHSPNNFIVGGGRFVDLKVEVSQRLREHWQDGREYYAYHGKLLASTLLKSIEAPDAEFLRWHNERRFLG